MASKNPDMVDVQVGNRIRLRRQHLGMAQAALGKAVGLSFQQIQKYEKGTNRVTPSRLQRLADAMQVPIPYFFGGVQADSTNPVDEQFFSTEIDAFFETEHGRALARALMRIENKGLRKSICDLVKLLA